MYQNEVSPIDKIVLHDADEAKLSVLGNKQEMDCNFNLFSIFEMYFHSIATVGPTLMINTANYT